MIRNLARGVWVSLFVLTVALWAARPVCADLIGSDLEPAEAVTASAPPAASPIPVSTTPSEGPLAAVRGQLRSLGLSPTEIEHRVCQLNHSEIESLCRDPQQLQVAGGFQIAGIEAGAAVVIFLVVAVIIGLWWWFGE